MTLSSIRDYCTLLACLLCAACGTHEARGKITVAAAADLRFALPEIVRQFQAANPAAAVSPVYGSSGNFYAQIRNGAPFDVFLSADVQYPERLISEKLAVASSRLRYATGRLAIWVPANSPLDPARDGFQVLDGDSVKHVAIANPQHAPYGRAAEAALRSMGLYYRIAPKLVLGENIAQTLEFVQTGAAETGIVALSLAKAPSVQTQGRYWEIPPAGTYPPIVQEGVVLSRAAGSEAALAFLRFLATKPAQSTFAAFGFSAGGR